MTIGVSETKAKDFFGPKLAYNWGHVVAQGWAALPLDRVCGFVVAPFSTPCSFGEGSPPWPSDRTVMVTRRVASPMNGAYNFIIFMYQYQMAYGYHFSHSNAHITAISSFTPSSTACPVGVQFLPWKRGGSALRSSTTTYCEMLLWSREHRSSLTVYIPSIDQLPRWGSRVLTVSFPSPAQPLNLCMICEEKNPLRFPLLCGFFHFFFHPSGPRLAAPRWVKASYRWSGYDFGLGGEEFGSG